MPPVLLKRNRFASLSQEHSLSRAPGHQVSEPMILMQIIKCVEHHRGGPNQRWLTSRVYFPAPGEQNRPADTSTTTTPAHIRTRTLTHTFPLQPAKAVTPPRGAFPHKARRLLTPPTCYSPLGTD